MIISLFILFILIFVAYKFVENKNELAFISSENIEKDLLEETKAIIYFSTTADQDYDGKGRSYATFVQNNHSIETLKMNGLELGGIAVGENKEQIMLEDKDTVHIIDKELAQFPIETVQYTGERTGYLDAQGLFFSIYNTGFSPNGYQSDIRFGNKEKIQTDSIPYYIVASGVNDDKIQILTQDFDTNSFTLREVLIQEDELKISDVSLLQTETTENMQALAPVTADAQYYYLILSTVHNETNETVGIYRINKETAKQDYYELVTYNDVELTATIPYNYKNSASIYGSKLYYINGLGDVYSFDLESTEVKYEFELIGASKSKIRNNAETYFKDGKLYVLRFNANAKTPYYLETYSLKQCKRTDTFEIDGLEKLLDLEKAKSIYSYDLKVF